jgi:hypothetical protein
VKSTRPRDLVVYRWKGAAGSGLMNTICTQSSTMLLPTCLIREGACSCVRGSGYDSILQAPGEFKTRN